MPIRKAPEKFVVGEKVIFRKSGIDRGVEVVTVEGDEVTVINNKGAEMVFKSRSSDFRHVLIGTETREGSPAFILHVKPARFRPKRRKGYSPLLPSATGGGNGRNNMSGSGFLEGLFHFFFGWMN